MTGIRNDFDTIIFDLDGTLVDSLPDMVVALNRHLSDEGRRILEIAEVRSLIGGGATEMVRSAFDLTGAAILDDDLVSAVKKYMLYYKEFPAKLSKVYDDVETVLSVFNNADIKMGVCSNKSYEMVRLILESFGLFQYFYAVTGGDNVPFNKPDGRHILETLERMGTSSKNVLMVGDTVNDISAAHDISIPVIAVDYGYSNQEDLSSATVTIDSFIKLLNLLPETGNN